MLFKGSNLSFCVPANGNIVFSISPVHSPNVRFYFFPLWISLLLRVLSVQEHVKQTCLLNMSPGMEVHIVFVPFFFSLFIVVCLVARSETPVKEPEAKRLSEIDRRGKQSHSSAREVCSSWLF